MKLLYFTDVHGNADAYKRGLEVAMGERASILLGGGLLPLPYFTSVPNIRKFAVFFGQWLERAHCGGVEVYLTFGSDDLALTIPEFQRFQERKLCQVLNNSVMPFKEGYWLAGYPFVPISTYDYKDFEKPDTGETLSYRKSKALLSDRGDVREGTLIEVLARQTIEEDMYRLSQKSSPEQTIYVMHAPPAETNLDVASDGAHVGSRAIRRFIQTYQPPLTLHGYCHDSPTQTRKVQDQIGKTMCFNPGASLQKFRGIFIEIKKGQADWALAT